MLDVKVGRGFEAERATPSTTFLAQIAYSVALCHGYYINTCPLGLRDLRPACRPMLDDIVPIVLTTVLTTPYLRLQLVVPEAARYQ